MGKGWPSVFNAIWRWDVDISIEMAVVLVIVILIVVVLVIYDKCCAGTELNPNEIEMTEFHPYVEPEAIEDNRQNERELAPVSNEDDSTIPIDDCVIITENVVQRTSQASECGNEEAGDEEEGNANPNPDQKSDIETNIASPSNMEPHDTTPAKEIGQSSHEGSENSTTEVNTSDHVSISMEDD